MPLDKNYLGVIGIANPGGKCGGCGGLRSGTTDVLRSYLLTQLDYCRFPGTPTATDSLVPILDFDHDGNHSRAFQVDQDLFGMSVLSTGHDRKYQATEDVDEQNA